MYFEKFVHNDVNPDGTFKHSAGAVVTEGGIRIGMDDGCGIEGCNCSEGYWVMIAMPLVAGKVEGIRVQMTKEEMQKFLKEHSLEVRK